jgi:hypothetical protein
MWLASLLYAHAAPAEAVVQVDASRADVGVYVAIDRDAERGSDVIPYQVGSEHGYARLACIAPCFFARPAGEALLLFRMEDDAGWQRVSFHRQRVDLRPGATHLYIDRGDPAVSGAALALSATGALAATLSAVALGVAYGVPSEDPADDRVLRTVAWTGTAAGLGGLGIGLVLQESARPRLRILVRP